MRLIDADRLVKTIKRFLKEAEGEEVYDEGYIDGCNDALDAIREAPTIGKVKYRTGKNLNKDCPSLFECSECGESCFDTYVLDHEDINFCPHCGADMRGDKHEIN